MTPHCKPIIRFDYRKFDSHAPEFQWVCMGTLSFLEDQANVLPNVGTQGIVAR